MSSLLDFLDSVGAKPTTQKDEWVMDCWECQRPLLFFNVEKVIGFCVYCNKTRTLSHIARTVAGVSSKDLEQFIEDYKAQQLKQGSFRESMLNGLLGTSGGQADKELVEMKWPEGYRSLEDGKSSVTGRKASDYLTGRGFDLEKLYDLQFGYCAQGFYSGRIIIPTFMDARLVYWQARDFTGSRPVSEKILNPKSGQGANGKSDVLFNYDSARNCSTAIICESWGSALATSTSCAMAVNGKSISGDQQKLIANCKVETVIILFDAGVGADSAWSSAEALSRYKRTFVALLPWGDPNEVPSHVRNESIRNCIPYSKAEHLRYRLGRLG